MVKSVIRRKEENFPVSPLSLLEPPLPFQRDAVIAEVVGLLRSKLGGFPEGIPGLLVSTSAPEQDPEGLPITGVFWGQLHRCAIAALRLLELTPPLQQDAKS